MLIVETAFIFSKSLHHRFWILDFRRRLGGDVEFAEIEQDFLEGTAAGDTAVFDEGTENDTRGRVC